MNKNIETQERNLAEDYVNFLSLNAVPKARTLDEIQKVTTKDKTLQCVVHITRNQGRKNLDALPEMHKEADLVKLKLFRKVHSETKLTINNKENIILH